MKSGSRINLGINCNMSKKTHKKALIEWFVSLQNTYDDYHDQFISISDWAGLLVCGCYSNNPVIADMPPWTVTLLHCLFAVVPLVTGLGTFSFDCDHPTNDYTCEGGRYYKVLDNVLWQEAHDKCIGDGTQLAIAYSAADIESMNRVVGMNLEFFCKSIGNPTFSFKVSVRLV